MLLHTSFTFSPIRAVNQAFTHTRGQHSGQLWPLRPGKQVGVHFSHDPSALGSDRPEPTRQPFELNILFNNKSFYLQFIVVVLFLSYRR